LKPLASANTPLPVRGRKLQWWPALATGILGIFGSLGIFGFGIKAQAKLLRIGVETQRVQASQVHSGRLYGACKTKLCTAE